MFGKLGQIAGLMKNLPKIREEMDKFQGRLGQLTAEGDAGGGMVKVTVNGKMEMQSCKLSDEVFNNPDREFLEDLIVAAANKAVQKVRELVSTETTKMATELGLPSGMDLPGLG